jgi:hypothetical protein
MNVFNPPPRSDFFNKFFNEKPTGDVRVADYSVDIPDLNNELFEKNLNAWRELAKEAEDEMQQQFVKSERELAGLTQPSFSRQTTAVSGYPEFSAFFGSPQEPSFSRQTTEPIFARQVSWAMI